MKPVYVLLGPVEDLPSPLEEQSRLIWGYLFPEAVQRSSSLGVRNGDIFARDVVPVAGIPK